ncbi:hypothetical protein WR25_20888 [Diploscapter pachys]|uniref:Protein FRA10AC1 homolog n=1 Tax=Diploscapter pachys TaxID=2018661 RepID=A0A2A2KSK5_9BILA|nr:hypothetical protein WR25_20888 [Diploscapter pachys]
MDDIKRNPSFHLDDLSSDFGSEYGSDVEGTGRKRRTDFLHKEYPGEEPKKKRSEGKHWFQDEHSRVHRQLSRLQTLDAYQRHKQIINLYYLTCPGAYDKLMKRDESKDRTDYDVLVKNHKFLWSIEDEAKLKDSWEARMAKKYYDKLFKEYCIVDLTYYAKNRIAMRWRIEKELESGKGQFICGNKKCNEQEALTSWEVNFAYEEGGERKNALVKVRLCPQCSEMLNYCSKKKKVEKKSKKRRDEKKIKKDDSPGPSTSKQNEDEEPGKKGDKKESKESAAASTEIWEKPIVVETERTVDEDIDDFLDDLFQ